MTGFLLLAVVILGLGTARLFAVIGRLEARLRVIEQRLRPIEQAPVVSASAYDPAHPAVVEAPGAEPRVGRDLNAGALDDAVLTASPARDASSIALESDGALIMTQIAARSPMGTYVADRPAAEPAISAAGRSITERWRTIFDAEVGGRLPIWTGGGSLVLAAFFLVRYTIERDLLGPAPRSIIAGIFGLVLIIAGEGARRWRPTRDDRRIGQALAGAGIAALYATTYLATSRYHLVGTATALALLVIVTIAALSLALRQGAPTAIMALVGGFTAPLLAGIQTGSVAPLLVYLTLLITALFGVAVRRDWGWLALAACGGGFGWINWLMFSVLHDATLPRPDAVAPGLHAVGGFVVLLAIGAATVLPRAGPTARRFSLIPLIAGLLELLILTPALDFGVTAWALDLLLAAAALWLGARDVRLVSAPAIALALLLILLGIAFDRGHGQRTVVETSAVAAAAATLLLGGTGQALAMRLSRAAQRSWWVALAVGGTAGPVLVAVAAAPAALPPPMWAALLGLAAAACAWLSWRARHDGGGADGPIAPLVAGAGAAALLMGAAAAELLAAPWRWPAWLAIGAALAGWGRRTQDPTTARLARLPLLVTLASIIATPSVVWPYALAVLVGPVASPVDLIAVGLLPALLLALTAWLSGARNRDLEWAALIAALGLVAAALPPGWHAAGLAAASAALLLRRSPPPGGAAAAAAAAVASALPIIAGFGWLAVHALIGDPLPARYLPPLADVLRALALPASLIGPSLWLARVRASGPPGWARKGLVGVALAAAAALYALAKQPGHIVTADGFEAWGMTERAAITQGVFVAAWAARTRFPALARALLIAAVARLLWFDLILLNPIAVRQAVGDWPIANVATVELAGSAGWLGLMSGKVEPRRAWMRIAALLLVAASVAVTVRQAVHGSYLTGPVVRTENWLYSAALLGLAIAWLIGGISLRSSMLRTAGLAMLMIVTLKVFLVDAAALAGILRILSFLGLGLALIAIGWGHRRFPAPQPARPD